MSWLDQIEFASALLYGYVGGDPINFRDPSGLIGIGICRPSDSFCILTGSLPGSQNGIPGGAGGRGSGGGRGGFDFSVCSAFVANPEAIPSRCLGSTEGDGRTRGEEPKEEEKVQCNRRLLGFANRLADFGEAANRAGDAGLISAGALAVAGAVSTATVVGAPVGLTAEAVAVGFATSSSIVKAVGAFAAIGGQVAASIATGTRSSIGGAIFTATAAIAPFKLGAGASFFQDKVADAAGKLVGFGNTPYICPKGS